MPELGDRISVIIPRMFADEALHDAFFELTRKLGRQTAETATRVLGLGDTFLDLGETYAVYAGKGSFLTQAKGAFYAEHLKEIVAFYKRHGCSWEAIVTPFVGHKSLQRLLDAGGTVEQWECALYRTLDDPPGEEVLGEGVEIVEIAEGEKGLWTSVMERGFFGDETNDMLRALGRIYEEEPDMVRYLASVDGAPAAGASMVLSGRCAYFSGASTIAQFRGLGLQNALISRRLRDAHGVADVVFVGTSPGSTSQRNAERHGFRMAFNQLSLRIP